MRRLPAEPSGFAPHASGLLVPEPLSREREVWSYGEWKILERATQLLKRREIQIFLRCNRPACQKAPMERLRRNDGGITLRCAHRDREFLRL